MQLDFHYYATYCAARFAGYEHEESAAVCYSDQFTDICTRTLLSSLGAPRSAATTQLQLELANARTDLYGLQDITRIWSSFHFLPYDLYAEPPFRCSKRYKKRYRLICNPNGKLLADTVDLAKGKSLQAAGIAMHVLADTWAHRYFAGTPSLVINNVNYHFYEIFPSKDGEEERKISFRHNPARSDDPELGHYTGTIYQNSEHSIMNLGHGRAGHLPDYSFMKYRYLPAWGNYEEILKDNPSDYYHAFTQMIYAMRFLRGDHPAFETDRYDTDTAAPFEEEILSIFRKRQLDSSSDWRSFAEEHFGKAPEDFDPDLYLREYKEAPQKEKGTTFLGKYIVAALAQKSMVTNRIYQSGNLLAGYSVDYQEKGLKGIRDFRELIFNREEQK